MAKRDVQIVRAGPGDEALFDRVAGDVFDDAPRAPFLTPYLAAPGHGLFLALADGVIIGQARGVVHFQPDDPPDLYIDNLGVDAPWRRRGVASRLVTALIGWGREQGCRAVWVATESDNDVARAFYDSFGFGGETIAYYSLPGPDD